MQYDLDAAIGERPNDTQNCKYAAKAKSEDVVKVENKEPTEAQIAEVENAFLKLYMGDIFKSLRIDAQDITPETVIPEGAACVAATLTACCLIELAGRFKGGNTSSQAFEAFAKYMQKKSGHNYKESDLYRALRCGLIHSGTTNNDQKTLKYVLSATSKSLSKDTPLQREATGSSGQFDKVNELQIQTFVADLKIALESYFTELREDESKLRAPFLKAYKKFGFLTTFEMRLSTTFKMPP